VWRVLLASVEKRTRTGNRPLTDQERQDLFREWGVEDEPTDNQLTPEGEQ
jgi:hypothetical protein